MLFRIVQESIRRGLRRKLLSGAAVALGIAVATALGTMALDVGDKVSLELRSFGANISVTSAADSLPITVGGIDYRPKAAGAFLAEGDLGKLRKIFWRNNIVAFAPFLFAPARIQGRSVVVIGTWFEHDAPVEKSEMFRTGLAKLHPAWKVEGRWPDETEAACLLGIRLAGGLGVKPDETINLESSGPIPTLRLTVRGILDTGGAEDDQLLAPLGVVQRWTGLEGKVRRVEVSALTKPEDAFARRDTGKMSPQEFDRWFCSPYVRSIAYQITQAIPGAEAMPVYQVAEAEGKVLDRVGALMMLLAGAGLLTAALAVASMMIAMVVERRTEIGLYKSLGAADMRVAAIFLSEALVVALAGGVLGYAAGSALARYLAAGFFGAPAAMHWVIFPAAVALALGLTFVGCALPLVRGLRVSPAVVLRD